MSVWYCIPSARPPEEAERVLKLWRERGYKIALCRDTYSHEEVGQLQADVVFVRDYRGYAEAVNWLIGCLMETTQYGPGPVADPLAEWFVTGGDDVEPDMNNTAEEIAQQCSEHFSHIAIQNKFSDPAVKDLVAHADAHMTFGVMQPTGDRFAGGSIDRICGSPWMGREFCRRMYGGKGPLFEGYRHMFVDEELQEVALKLDVLWQRPDLIHLHRHFMREDETDLHSDAVKREAPAHLVKWNTQEHWAESQKLFRERKAAGFPGHEPIP